MCGTLQLQTAGAEATEAVVDLEALQAAAATAQWVDTTTPTAASAAQAASGGQAAAFGLAAAEADVVSLEQPAAGQQPAEPQPAADFGTPPQAQQTPLPATHPAQQLTPGTGFTEYHTPAAEGGDAGEQAAAAAMRGMPGQLGHVVSLGAAWLKRGASSHASVTTGYSAILKPPANALHVSAL